MQTQTKFHPVHHVYDGKFNAKSGIIIDLHNPTEDMINIKDISNALSKICRFGGQITEFYSVAQHSYLVSCLLPYGMEKEGLLHDASEAYLQDLISPLKQMIPDYKKIESRFEAVIAHKFNLRTDVKELIKEADMWALELEHEAFQQNKPGKLQGIMQIHGMLINNNIAWSHVEARAMFYARYFDLFEI